MRFIQSKLRPPVIFQFTKHFSGYKLVYYDSIAYFDRASFLKPTNLKGVLSCETN